MPRYAGIDLHPSNNYIGVIDANDKRLCEGRHENRLENMLKALAPLKRTLKGFVIESTYNWYWLVDRVQDHGFQVHLANPTAIK